MKSCHQGQVREIVVPSPLACAITLGYHAFPKAMVETIRNRWFQGGNLAYRDDGCGLFVNRKKDSIPHHGENISACKVIGS